MLPDHISWFLRETVYNSHSIHNFTWHHSKQCSCSANTCRQTFSVMAMHKWDFTAPCAPETPSSPYRFHCAQILGLSGTKQLLQHSKIHSQLVFKFLWSDLICGFLKFLDYKDPIGKTECKADVHLLVTDPQNPTNLSINSWGPKFGRCWAKYLMIWFSPWQSSHMSLFKGRC